MSMYSLQFTAFGESASGKQWPRSSVWPATNGLVDSCLLALMTAHTTYFFALFLYSWDVAESSPKVVLSLSECRGPAGEPRLLGCCVLYRQKVSHNGGVLGVILALAHRCWWPTVWTGLSWGRHSFLHTVRDTLPFARSVFRRGVCLWVALWDERSSSACCIFKSWEGWHYWFI